MQSNLILVSRMSSVEILSYVKKIVDKLNNAYGFPSSLSDVKTICVNPQTCYNLFQTSISLTWDSNGNLTEVRITGTDQEGNTRTFKKTLTWSAEGYLQNVSSWQEV